MFQLRTIHPHTQPRLIASPNHAPMPQDEPPAAPAPTKPTKRTQCSTCKARLSKWGYCDACRARMARDIQRVERKFPRGGDVEIF